jgi:hypothetical protein
MSGCYVYGFYQMGRRAVDVMSDNALIALIEDNYVARHTIVAPGGLRGLMQ